MFLRTYLLLGLLHLAAPGDVRAKRALQQQAAGVNPLEPLPPLIPLPELEQIVAQQTPDVNQALDDLDQTLRTTAATYPATSRQALPQQPQLPQPQQQPQPAQQPQPQAQQPQQQQAALAASLAAQQQQQQQQQQQVVQQRAAAAQQQQQQQQQATAAAQSQAAPVQHTSFDSLVQTSARGAPATAPGSGGLLPAFAPFGAPLSGPAPGAQAALAADSCMAAATRLVGGACAAFAVAFRQRPDALARLDEQGFREAVALGPTPSDACCVDLRAYTEGGCACDAPLGAYAPHIGLQQQALPLVARAAVMACPRYNIVNPCTQQA